jgi:glucosamine--fructose-6-phosphate aminotransferase (isomerizing)
VKHAQALDGSMWTLTAERHSPIGAIARRLIEIPVGPEPVGPKTKGYTASVLTLILVARALAGGRLDVGGYLADSVSRAMSSIWPLAPRVPPTSPCRGPEQRTHRSWI